jgi:two-component system response regulator MprA
LRNRFIGSPRSWSPELLGLTWCALGTTGTIHDGLQLIVSGSRELREKRLVIFGRSGCGPYAGAMAVGGPRIVVAEDDRAVRQSLERTLRLEGYVVFEARTGVEALDACARELPDLVILDVMMPEMDGLTACRTLRSENAALPILMLTARHQVGDRVAGLEAGADDYLVKPYASIELIARVRALLRRGCLSGSKDLLRCSDLTLDPAARLAWRGDRRLTLTKTEFDLLELLTWNAGVVLSRDTLYERIWGYDFETSSRALDVYIGYLRNKLEERGEPRLVQTVRGVGFVVREQ